MFKKLVGKIRKRKFNYAKLSSQDKVNHLSEKAIGLFDHMKQAHEELGNINNELELIVASEDQKVEQEIERHQRELRKLTDNKVKAIEEIQMNKKVQEKLVDFIR